MVRKAEKQDLEILANLAVLMWDSHSVSELMAEFSEIISNGKSQFFLNDFCLLPSENALYGLATLDVISFFQLFLNSRGVMPK